MPGIIGVVKYQFKWIIKLIGYVYGKFVFFAFDKNNGFIIQLSVNSTNNTGLLVEIVSNWFGVKKCIWKVPLNNFDKSETERKSSKRTIPYLTLSDPPIQCLWSRISEQLYWRSHSCLYEP